MKPWTKERIVNVFSAVVYPAVALQVFSMGFPVVGAFLLFLGVATALDHMFKRRDTGIADQAGIYAVTLGMGLSSIGMPWPAILFGAGLPAYLMAGKARADSRYATASTMVLTLAMGMSAIGPLNPLIWVSLAFLGAALYFWVMNRNRGVWWSHALWHVGTALAVLFFMLGVQGG